MMNSSMKTHRKALLLLPSLCLTSLVSLSIQAQDVNPNQVYLFKGEAVSRTISLGDPSNWYTPVENRTGKSAGNKISVAPTDFKGTGDAIQIIWNPRKKVDGVFSIGGNPIDLTAMKDVAALAIDMRVDVKPDKDIKVRLSCEYPCQADVSIRKMINQMPKNEWFSLPIPLNCFKGEKFDLSKISSPFILTSDGKATISITNVRLEKLADGDKGCAD